MDQEPQGDTLTHTRRSTCSLAAALALSTTLSMSISLYRPLSLARSLAHSTSLSLSPSLPLSLSLSLSSVISKKSEMATSLKSDLRVSKEKRTNNFPPPSVSLSRPHPLLALFLSASL